jgi:hypothetical protein
LVGLIIGFLKRRADPFASGLRLPFMRASTILSEQCPPSTRPDVTSIAPVDLEAAPTEFDWTQSLALHLSGQRLIRRKAR